MGKVKFYQNTEASILARTPDKDGIYFSTDTNKILRSYDGSTYVEMGPKVLNSTGTSTAATMSQAAITSGLSGKVSFIEGTPDTTPSMAGQMLFSHSRIFISGFNPAGGYAWYDMGPIYISTTTAPVITTSTTSTTSGLDTEEDSAASISEDTNNLEQVVNDYLEE